MFFQERLLQEIERLIQESKILQKIISDTPDTPLHISHSSRGTRYRQRIATEKGIVYKEISRKNITLLSELSTKEYSILRSKEINELLSQMNELSNTSSDSSSLLSSVDFSRYFPELESQKKNRSEWLKRSFETNTDHLENLIYPTFRGEKVRSKSEALIANTLFNLQIPYHYESKFNLGSTILYPDFMIFDPVSQREIPWEHFGMMDSETYSRSTLNKLSVYYSNGYIPDINFIATYETRLHPLDTRLILAKLEAVLTVDQEVMMPLRNLIF